MHAIIATGDDIYFRDDIWLNGTILSRACLEIRGDNSEHVARPSEFISGGCWDERRLEEVLGPAVVNLAL